MIKYAHSVPDRSESEWELLEEHAQAVALRASTFAAGFEGQEIACLLGMIHDLGKIKPRFQAKLRGEANNEPHSGEGARLLQSHYGGLGLLLGACVAGHHSGLPDIADLHPRLAATQDIQLPEWLTLPAEIAPFGPLLGAPSPFSVQFAVRMLFSCLIDADELETAAFYDGLTGNSVTRAPHTVTEAHKAAFDEHMAGFDGAEGPVNTLRTEILATARKRATLTPGLFSMTVPTGGGKTLASLGFSLDHALVHGMERIIHVIPFTSIVEQTADVFSRILEPEAVVEHHSSFDWENVTEDEAQQRLRRVTRNWDAPIIVTTAVQFFESLFAARKRRCAKLHNLARSVIVIDEAQTMPRHLLRPCLAAIRELTAYYGASVVLSTATQPVVTREAGLDAPEALSGVRELAPDPPALYRALKRVRVTDVGEMGDDALTKRIEAASQVLTIVGNRRHARVLFARVADLPGSAHLSTMMTPMHRRNVLAQVRENLRDGAPTRLISTSLVEAGVDIDFPLVMRAATGLDSVAQAAGRCNREGKLTTLGEVLVFTPMGDDAKAPEEIRARAEITKKIIAAHSDDPLSEVAIAEYFRRYLWQVGPEALDAATVSSERGVVTVGILKEIAATGNDLNIRFDAIARAFRMIDDAQAPVIIRGGRWGIPDNLLKSLEWREGTGGIARALQPYIVNVPHGLRRELEINRAASLWREDLFGREFLLLDHGNLYDERAGMRMDKIDEGDWIW